MAVNILVHSSTLSGFLSEGESVQEGENGNEGEGRVERGRGEKRERETECHISCQPTLLHKHITRVVFKCQFSVGLLQFNVRGLSLDL